MKRVLVTGVRGFIGRHAVPLLRERGYEIFGVTSAEPKDGSVNLLRADLRDPSAAESVMAEVRPTHLLHLAWTTEHGRYWESAENLSWVAGSLGLYRSFAKHGGKRVVTSGSCAEYDWGQGKCIEDSTPLNPNSLYGHAKLSLFHLQQVFFERAGIGSAWGRVFLCYGPHEFPKRFVPSVITSLLRGECAKCTAGGQLRDFLYVEDVAGALVELLESGVVGAVNVASGEPLPLAEVANLIADKLDGNALLELGSLPAPMNDPPCLFGDTSRLFAEVGWRPRFTLNEGMDRTIAWWRDNS